LADIYGRRIVMIGGTIIALVASGCTSIQGISLNGYMAARFFQGIGASPAATVGLSIINDLSFEHERGFRIGLWVMAIDLGGLCGGFGELIIRVNFLG
jgi:MFS family permease